MAHIDTLANIPIKIISAQSDNLALAKTLLYELQTLLSTLLDTGENGTLDLRALPAMGEEGYQFLKEKLGLGEVSARILSFGHSEIQETSFPGIWWVTHYNQEEDVLTELIEVSFVPEILKSPKDDVVSGAVRLGKLLGELTEYK